MKPPSTATISRGPSSQKITTALGSSTPSTGSWPARIPISPSTVLAMTLEDLPDHTTRSAETTSTCMGSAISLHSRLASRPFESRADFAHRITPPADPVRGSRSGFLLQLRPATLDVLHAADVEECLLSNVINFSVAYHPERLYGLIQRDTRPWDVGELLSHVGVLAEELLDATGPVHHDLVFLGQLVDTQDGDDVLQLLVALQNLLDSHRHVVVLLADVLRVKDSAARCQRIHCRVETTGSDLARKLSGGVQVSECGGRGRVGVVVGRHIDRLHGGDRVPAGGGNPLLQLAH